MINQDLEDAIAKLLYEKTGNEFFCPGEDRIKNAFQDILQSIGDLNVKIVTVAGTNGKGETAISISRLLTRAGYSPLLFLSPHIDSICERISFCDEMIDANDLLTILQDVLGHYHLSYFESLFMAYLKYALLKRPTHLVMEVGMGGRLDATNLLDADVAVITSIAREHQAILGYTYREILSEKFGVTRSGKELFTFFTSKYLLRLTRELCAKKGVHLTDLGVTLNREIPNYSMRNRLLASYVAAKFITGLDIFEACSYLDTKKYESRKEVLVVNHHQFTFIGAHNVEGMRALYLEGDHFENAVVAFSRRPREDLEVLGDLCFKIADSVSFTFFRHPKAITRDELPLKFHSEIFENWGEKLANLSEIKGSTVIMGSYYFIAEVKKYFANL